MSSFELKRMREIKKGELVGVLRSLEFVTERERPHYRFKRDDSGVTVIAEVKKESPTEKLNLGADVISQACEYQKGGANAISVLVDSKFFSGSWHDLASVANSVTLPVLCKEFVYFKEQVELAYYCGADLVLLIAQVLDDAELAMLYEYILSFGMMPLIEINSIDEIERVASLKPELMMVNLRDLNTLIIDPDKGAEVLSKIPESFHRISASGIKTPMDVSAIKAKSGVSTFLIGSSLMKSQSPAKFIEELRNVS